jgi:predicted transcriptional regulator of viral defense system
MAYKPRIFRHRMQRTEALEAVLEAASEQGGYVTAAQAARLGLTRDDVARLSHARDLQRVRRGIYRMRHASRAHEDEIAAWLHFEQGRLPWERRGATEAVVSHASAAGLRSLGTIIPQRPTITLALGSGRAPHITDIDIRRAALTADDWSWLKLEDVTLPVTTPARTIVDLLLDGEEPSYVLRATREVLTGQLATPEEIMAAARNRKNRSKALQARTATLLDQAA